MTARVNVLDLLPSSRPRNPELVGQLLDDATATVPTNVGAVVGQEAVAQGARRKRKATEVASTTLARVPVEEEVQARKIRVSMHVTKEKHYLVRKGAAELNMSVDAFIAEAVDAALRGLSLLD